MGDKDEKLLMTSADNVVRGVGCDARRGCGEEMGVSDGINDA